MDKNEILQLIADVFRSTEGNRCHIPGREREITFFDDPLTGFSSADDPIFETYKDPDIIGPRYMTPLEWLPEARTVITVSLPFTEEVRKSTRDCRKDPSIEWLYGRVEGHAFLMRFMRNLADRLRAAGIRCCVPMDDKRYTRYPREYEDQGVLNRHIEIVWSERHAGFAGGLGTFGLSRCLITEKGTAMRLVSCIIDTRLEPTPRNYCGHMDYCTLCGACIRRCPAGAISFERGKNNILCGDWNNGLQERHAPLYGCHACMTSVPCECGLPEA